MKKNSVRTVLKALNAGGVRFLVAGGLAVNAHGYQRFTADVDLGVELLPENVRKAFEALRRIGYKPAEPVSVDEFSDRKTRARWIREKGMMVLQFWSDAHRETSVDVFVKEPFRFAAEYRKSFRMNLIGREAVLFVSFDTLLKMKRSAGRPKDLIDIDELRRSRKAQRERS